MNSPKKNLKFKMAILNAFSSQDDFAFCVRISPDRLSKIIHGKVKSKPSEVAHFCRVLKSKPKDLGLKG